ncbi:zonular occludens toxin domain-containing protein [Polaromonas sp.]|uniref:zonular occludens toxin domain-containing protein n=1 Tax=Polaromonas sp. TaxID=1869339 RepID=UPI003C9AD81B
MIILITGTPGAGKSLYGVSELLNKQFKDRPLYVNGVPDLLLPHEPLTDEDVGKWYDGRVPENGVIFIDEAQRIWRPRSSSVTVPQSLTEMETHRHKGIDIIVVTQAPAQLDAHLRRLVGRHIHVRRTWGLHSAVVYEWDTCTNMTSFKTAQTKVWRYNKSAFKLYKSSQKHTKAGGSIPMVVWVLLLAILALPFMGWNTTRSLLQRFSGGGDATVAKSGVTPPKPGLPGAAPKGDKAPLTPQQYVDQFKPRIAGMMHSAPAYDSLTAIKTVPLPAACISSNRPSWVAQHGGPCGCYTQTGQHYETTQAMCLQYVRNAVFFPFLDAPDPKATARPEKPPVAASPAPVAETPGVSVMPAPAPYAATSTVQRDSEVLSFMAKRKYIN